jgi:hypothetical protein
MIKSVLFLCLLSANIAIAAEPETAINSGYSGHWVDLGHPGQGVIVEVLPVQKKLAIGWFSFANGAPGNQPLTAQRWFTGLGGYAGNQASLTLFDTEGGMFAQAGDVNTVAAGTASFRALSCTKATLNYQFNSGLEGVLDLVRLTPAGLCLALSGHDNFPLFAFFRAQADAEFQDGMSVDCELNYIIELELQSNDGFSRVYNGTLGGEARRTVIDSTGGGIGFMADAFGLVEVQLVGHRIDIRYLTELPDRLPSEADSRFWNHLNAFSGEIASDGRVEGSWHCAPLDTRGDESLFANGVWTLELSTDEPPPR